VSPPNAPVEKAGVAKLPGRQKDEAKREAIVAAARGLFMREAYERVSMDAIAAEARVSKVTIYSHFTDKEALFVAAISTGCEAIFADVAVRVGQGSPLREALAAFGVAFVEMITHPEVEALHAVMMAQGARSPALPQRFYETVVEGSTRRLADALAKEAAAGKIALPDPYTGAVQFIAMVQGEFRYRQELGLPSAGSSAVRTYVEACVETILRAWRI
jgi:TetR/AcrR family transcriptional regulator, mexJK operon transcriptional repressor